MSYSAPLRDIQFVLYELAGMGELAKWPGLEEAAPDTVAAVLEEARKFATNVLAPLNAVGDRQGARLQEDGTVTTAPGFKDAYLQFAANGWAGLSKNPHFGGQGLPYLLSTAVEEMWDATNLAFALCPMLTQGAIEAIELCGTELQKKAYLPKMVDGTWTGTMNLTEPQAGSDLAAVRTRAVPQTDGSYKLAGQKIFITYGDHDYTENIIHMVLARLPNAPEGVKGISLFIVPKFVLNDDGTPGKRNDVHCIALEHKLGIHGSPTATLAFGDHGGAVGYLLGRPNEGLAYMFVMMNLARFSVGVQGLGVSEGAYQHALAFAKERIQGKAVGSTGAGPILNHPDIRRLLLTMKAQIEAMRALAYVTGASLDGARAHPDPVERSRHQAFVDLMTPVVKGWCTETAQQITSDALQIFGGMGFIEETGAAQYYRDVRITTIYEGTTAIQANDLVGRKIARRQGELTEPVFAEMDKLDEELAAYHDAEFSEIRAQLRSAVHALKAATEWVVNSYASHPGSVFAGSVVYLKLWGIVAAGWQMSRAALVARRKLDSGGEAAGFYGAKIATARFFASTFLVQAGALKHTITDGAPPVLALSDDLF